jgi:hypothetical protein
VISPTLSVTLDYRSLRQQLGRYGKLVILNMLGRLG